MSTRTIDLNNKAVDFILQEDSEQAITCIIGASLAIQEDACFPIHPSPLNEDRPLQTPNTYYCSKNGYDEGMGSCSQPIRLHPAANGNSKSTVQATVNFNLAIAYTRIGQDCLALTILEGMENFTITRTKGFPEPDNSQPSASTIHQNIGHVHWRAKRHNQALHHYSTAMHAHLGEDPSGQPDTISMILNCMAVVELDRDQTDSSSVQNLLSKALSARLLDPKIKFSRETATVINNMGRFKFQSEDYLGALVSFREALELRMTLLGGNHLDVASTLSNIAQTHHHMGNINEAITSYEQFIHTIMGTYQTNHHCHIEHAVSALIRIGQLCYDREDLERASLYLNQALQSSCILSESSANDLVAVIHNKLGNILFSQRKYKSASSSYKAGLDIERKLYSPSDGNICVTLLNIARTALHEGSVNEAIERYNEALEIKRSVNDLDGCSSILFSISQVYETHEDYASAAVLLEEVVSLKRHLLGDTHFEVSVALNDLAIVQTKNGAINMALSYFYEALKIRQMSTGASQDDLSLVMLNIAIVNMSMGELETALKFFKQVQFSSDDAKKYHHEVLVLNQMSSIYQEFGDLRQASKCLQDALQIGLEHPEMLESGEATKLLKKLGELYIQNGELSRAMISFSAAMRLQESDPSRTSQTTERRNDVYLFLAKRHKPAAAAA